MHHFIMEIITVAHEGQGRMIEWSPWPESVDRVGGSNHVTDVEDTIVEYVNSHEPFNLVDVYTGEYGVRVIFSLDDFEYNRLKLTGTLGERFTIWSPNLAITLRAVAIK